MHENMEGVVNEDLDLFHSAHSTFDVLFGNHELLPRVGDQYQAEIPSLLENECWQLMRKPTETEVIIDCPSQVYMGLLLPVMWIHDDTGCIKERDTTSFTNQDVAIGESSPLEAENNGQSHITSNNDPVLLVGEEELGGLANSESAIEGDPMHMDLMLKRAKTTKLSRGKNAYHLVPDLLGEVWETIEYDSFLLGLYVFGKNLSLVKRFVETKKMCDILAYYYGKFYKSKEYNRWSDCRKMRSRKHVHGQKILTGWRQQELVSRLVAHVSEESQNSVMEFSRSFGQGNLTLEEYVFSLKNTVGLKVLVEAVAIGKGKQDLTGTTMEPTKTNCNFSIRPEIPSGKACSSLTSDEIIKLLTGDFRLSKARSNDIFWEAVWPRLLARGWHSEQPRESGFSGSRNSLVFLVPGVKKFKRRRLVKGNHYFDCVMDVLNKVASEPAILDTDMEAVKDGSNVEESRLQVLTQRLQILSKRKHHCYLQPLNLSCSNTMKFTIVDTSLFNGEDWVKVRELKSLPVEPVFGFTPSNLSCETEKETSEESMHGEEENNLSNPAEDVMKNVNVADSLERVTSNSGHSLSNVSDPTILEIAHDGFQRATVSKDSQPRMILKLQFNQKSKPRQSKYLNPIKKERHFTTCSQKETRNHRENISPDAKIKKESCCYQSKFPDSIRNIAPDAKVTKENSCCQSNSPDNIENVAFQMQTYQNTSSSTSLAVNQEESRQEIFNGKCPGIKDVSKNLHFQTKVDDDFSNSNRDRGIDEALIMNTVQISDHSTANNSSLSETSTQPEFLYHSKVEADVGLLPDSIGRRQSTRNRPLTRRALEALEYGFLETKKKRKATLVPSSQRANRKVAAASITSNDKEGYSSTSCKMINQGCKSNIDIVDRGYKSNIDMVDHGCKSNIDMVDQGCKSNIDMVDHGCKSNIDMVDQGCKMSIDMVDQVCKGNIEMVEPSKK